MTIPSLPRHFQDVFKTLSRCLQGVFKTSSRHLRRQEIVSLGRQEIATLKMSSRRLQGMPSINLQDAWETKNCLLGLTPVNINPEVNINFNVNIRVQLPIESHGR